MQVLLELNVKLNHIFKIDVGKIYFKYAVFRKFTDICIENNAGMYFVIDKIGVGKTWLNKNAHKTKLLQKLYLYWSHKILF